MGKETPPVHPLSSQQPGILGKARRKKFERKTIRLGILLVSASGQLEQGWEKKSIQWWKEGWGRVRRAASQRRIHLGYSNTVYGVSLSSQRKCKSSQTRSRLQDLKGAQCINKPDLTLQWQEHWFDVVEQGQGENLINSSPARLLAYCFLMEQKIYFSVQNSQGSRTVLDTYK